MNEFGSYSRWLAGPPVAEDSMRGIGVGLVEQARRRIRLGACCTCTDRGYECELCKSLRAALLHLTSQNTGHFARPSAP